MTERRGYTMGRLLAALDHLGVVPDAERLYVLASSDPSYLTAPLQRATAASEANRAALDPIIAPLGPDAFRATLTTEEQADFGLGYYHERAAIRRGRPPEVSH